MTDMKTDPELNNGIDNEGKLSIKEEQLKTTDQRDNINNKSENNDSGTIKKSVNNPHGQQTEYMSNGCDISVATKNDIIDEEMSSTNLEDSGMKSISSSIKNNIPIVENKRKSSSCSLNNFDDSTNGSNIKENGKICEQLAASGVTISASNPVLNLSCKPSNTNSLSETFKTGSGLSITVVNSNDPSGTGDAQSNDLNSSKLGNSKDSPSVTITPRRSSRKISKPKSYNDSQLIINKLSNEHDVVEESELKDPLALDDDDKSRSGRSNKTIVVSDTKGLAEFATTRQSKSGHKKEPTLVIIDTKSLMAGRGPIPLVHSSNNSPNSINSRNVHSSSSLTVTPVQAHHKAPVPQMKPIIVGPPTNSNAALLNQAKSTTAPVQTQQPTPPNILPELSDDMFVVEAPSFIVPYVYEKPPLKELLIQIEKLKIEIEKEKKSTQNSEEHKNEKNAIENDIKEEKIDDEDEKKKTNSEINDGLKTSEVKDMKKTDKKSTTHEEKSTSYFDLPLGKFFLNLGMNLVQEHVQTDLLRTHKRKRDKEGENCSADVLSTIDELVKTLESTKENNEPFKGKNIRRCELCSFKTDTSLVLAHHLETPHMKDFTYRCNFCPLEFRSPHDILFHMESEHNVRGRLERAPSFHQCPNCTFEDNQRGKLTRHLVSCAKKFKPDRNQEHPLDWEPPAKIPKVTRNRPPSMTTNPVGYQAAMHGLLKQSTNQNSLIQKIMPTTATSGKVNHTNIGNKGRSNTVFNKFSNQISPGNFNQRLQNLNQEMLLRAAQSNAQAQLIFPPGFRFVPPTNSNNPIYQNPTAKQVAQATAAATTKLLNQPSISITPLPRSGSQNASFVPGGSSNTTPKAKNVANKTSFVTCEICDSFIKDLEQLRNHMQWIHKVKIHPKMIYNRPPLNCQKCQYRFFTDQGLERHLLGSHGLVTSSMQEAANKEVDGGRCPVCGRVYQWKLLNHVAKDHHMTLKPAHLSYKCTVCTATFGMYKQFESHVYSAHSVVAKRALDGNKKSSGLSASSNSASNQNDPLLKPLKINDEITIIPQPLNNPSKSLTKIPAGTSIALTSKSKV